MIGHTVLRVCVERVEQRADNTTLWSSCVQGNRVRCYLSMSYYLESVCEKVLDPVTEHGIESDVTELCGKPVKNYGVGS